MQLKVPLIGKTIIIGEMARFSRTMSMLIDAGVPLPEIIRIVRETSRNKIVEMSFSDLEKELLQGQGIYAAMNKNPIFPKMMVHMVGVAEETGTLDTTLATVADYYDTQIDERTTAITSMIEPTMTLGIAVIVGFIALSVIMPMYQIVGSVG